MCFDGDVVDLLPNTTTPWSKRASSERPSQKASEQASSNTAMPELFTIQQGFLPLRTTDEPEVFESPAIVAPARPNEPKERESYIAPPEYSSEDTSALIQQAHDPVIARQFFDRHVLLAPVALSQPDEVVIRGGPSTGPQAGRLRESPRERLARLKREVEELQLQQESEGGAGQADGDLDALASSLDTVQLKEEDRELLHKVSLLESRLAQLEQRHSHTQAQPTRITLDQAHVNVPQLALLARQLSLLTATDEKRDALVQKLGTLASQSKIIRESPQAAQLETLYLATRETQANSVLVEMVIGRLRDLQDIHHDAAHATNLVASLESSLQERQVEIDRWQQAVTALQAKMDGSADVMEQNKQVIVAAVDKLRKDLDQALEAM